VGTATDEDAGVRVAVKVRACVVDACVALAFNASVVITGEAAARKLATSSEPHPVS
jgi:hypothetical protein